MRKRRRLSLFRLALAKPHYRRKIVRAARSKQRARSSSGGRSFPNSYRVLVPLNATDPHGTEWAWDPGAVMGNGVLVNNSGDDPTSPWRTPAREWRFAGNFRYLVASRDGLRSAYLVGQDPLPGGECPSLFPLPHS